MTTAALPRWRPITRGASTTLFSQAGFAPDQPIKERAISAVQVVFDKPDCRIQLQGSVAS